VITTGNEPTLAVADALEYLVELESIRSIAVFAEAIRKPEAFRRAAARAYELGKAIVLLKAGASSLGAKNALSHTGSLAGDDAVTDAVLQQLGVVRVRSLEELLTTSDLIAKTERVGRGGLGVVSLSGGGCGLIADAADRSGLHLPDFTAETTAELSRVVGAFAKPQNPFDVTAAAGDTTFRDALTAVSRQEDISVLAVLCNVPTHASGATPDVMRLLASIERGMSNVEKPSVLIAQTSLHLQGFGRERLAEAGIRATLPGIALAATALERLLWWSTRTSGRASAALRNAEAAALIPIGSSTSALSEWDSRARLGIAGVPFGPAELVADGDAAVAAWQGLGCAVAVKANTSKLAHKTDVGAVVLGADDEVSVREAVAQIETAILDATGSATQGIIIAPMRQGDVELIIGVRRDPVWGPTLVVGFGGVLVETLPGAAVRVLPVDRDEISEMLDSLSGVALLGPVRGRPGLHRDALISAIEAVAKTGTESGVDEVEVNPLLVTPAGVEGLDALIVRRGTPA
jgi:acyl-CoA synthetase (NDP forming)